MPGEEQALPFDLTRSQLGSQSDARPLRVIDERTATMFAMELSQLIQSPVQIKVVKSGSDKVQDYLSRLETPGCFSQLRVEALGGNALVAVERDFLFHLLERFLGGEGHPLRQSTDERVNFSVIEEKIIRKLVRLFGRAMEDAWRPLIPLKTRHLHTGTLPETVELANPEDWIIYTMFRVTVGMKPGYIQYALPASLIGAQRDRLRKGSEEDVGVGSQPWRESWLSLLNHIPVELVGELGRCKRTLEQVLRLEVGDVLRLDQPSEQPVNVSIGGLRKYHGEIMVHHGNLGIALTSVYPSQTEQSKESSHE